ncbi:tigger transposable element-derived protein 4-like [Octopus sinensis]|uniref:Tigger transposable element-derived protein 4-like n=1 Tax=Octopus sinensis TaxID=2607531 RepID=A0A6P7TX91_9MOLL|nr:tigger transposable element-derived protein 4-like [Octopus sinensis]XP_029657039.1 tigger transposable element-derived protein 4-like [Octopus sinensis]
MLLAESNCTNLSRKRRRDGKEKNVETALSVWFAQTRTKNVPINGNILTHKATSFAKTMKMDDFIPTSGWLQRWKERNNISFKRIYGEKKDSDINAAEYWCQWTLKDLLKDYTPENIYNCDETGLIFRGLPDRTLSFKNEIPIGSKKMKDRLTVMVSCNMTGSDKHPLMVIGKRKNPRCFKGIKTLPVNYVVNKVAYQFQ